MCGPNGLRAIEGAGEVHAQVALPELGRLLSELRRMVERAGVVHEDVDRAELFDRPSDGGVDLCALSHVAADRERPAPHAANLFDSLLGVHEPLLPCNGRKRAVAVGRLRELGLDEQVGDDERRRPPARASTRRHAQPS